jgi:hypothetical protein
MQSREMKPMFLPGVQNNPLPGTHAELIREAQAAGQEHWQIWHLFAFQPKMTAHLAKFTHEMMHEAAPISAGLRELNRGVYVVLERLRVLYQVPCGDHDGIAG